MDGLAEYFRPKRRGRPLRYDGREVIRGTGIRYELY